MNNGISYLMGDHQSNEDSDFSEVQIKNNNFKIEKYEKFKPKQKDDNFRNKSLKGAENKVKYLLSNFLKNIEIEKKGSYINKNEKLKKRKRRNSNENKNNKELKKTLTSTSTEKYQTSSSFIINSNRDRKKSNKNVRNVSFAPNTPELHLYSRNLNIKKKSLLSLNNIDLINNSATGKKFKKKSFGLFKKDEFEVNGTYKLDEKKNNFINGSGSHKIKKRESKGGKGENLIIDNLIKKINKKLNRKNTSSSIKKNKSLCEDKSYLNFKNDNVAINNKRKYSLNLGNSLWKKKANLEPMKKKIDIFNNSNRNSIRSDCSDVILNKKSIEKKEHIKFEEQIEEQKNKEIKNNPIIPSSFFKRHFSLFLKKRDSTSDINLSNRNIKTSLTSNKLSNIKKSNEIKNNVEDEFKRSGTNINNKNNNKLKFKRNSKFNRLNTNFKSLREQLRQSLILRPGEQDPSKEEEQNKNIKKKNL